MFLHLSVIHSVHSGRGVWQTPQLWAEIPRAEPPWADTPRWADPSLGRPPWADHPSPPTATAADGTASHWKAFLLCTKT